MRELRGERQNAALLDDEDALRAPDQNEPLGINIIGPDQLEYQGRSAHMSPAVLALNGLIMCRRDGFVAASVIRDRVGYDASHSSFREDIELIQDTLVSLTDQDATVETSGRCRVKQYHLSDLLDFIDRREDAASDPKFRQAFFELASPVPGASEFSDGWVEFRTNDARRRAFAAMLREVAVEPSVRWFGRQLMEGGWPHQLPSESLEDNLRYTEKALATFVQPDYDANRHRSVLIDGAMAFQEMLFSAFRRTDGAARHMTESQKGRLRDELFQDATEGLMEYIMTFRKDDQDGGTLAQFFYTKMAMVATGKMLHRLDEERWQALGVSDRKIRLIRRIHKEGGGLVQALGREPSPAELADKLGTEVDDIEEALHMMERSNNSIDRQYLVDKHGDYHDIEYEMTRAALRSDEIEDMIDHLDKRRQIDIVFDSNQIKTRDKIALSIYYGVYVSSLAGERFAKFTHDSKESFIYPDNEADFNTVVTLCEYSFVRSAALLGFNRGRFSKLIMDALQNSREVLRTASHTSMW